MEKSYRQKIDLLHNACKQGKLRKVQEIMKCADVKSFIDKKRGLFLYTPLHSVVVNNSSRSKDILECLLNHGADVSSISSGQYTPLHLAANIGDVESIKVLLKHKANLLLKDEFGKTPLKTAENMNRQNAAMLLRSAEVKLVLRSNFHELKKMIDTLRRGIDVTESCFNECLEIAVEEDLHLAAGFIILRKPDNVVDCLFKAIEYGSYKTAAMLLLCKSAITDDSKMINLLCRPVHLHEPVTSISRGYTMTKSLVLPANIIDELRSAVKNIDHAFPVAVACRDKQYGAVKCLLFNLYLNPLTRNVDWHGLALTAIQDVWIDEISNFQRLDFSYNYLRSLPTNMGILKSLRKLNLSNNKLDNISSSIFEDLPLINTINLQNNKIKTLPEITKWTSSLTTLNLQNNFLKTFPDNLEGAAIENLNLSNNKFVQFPESVCNLKMLGLLDVSFNKDITELPLKLGKLKKLNILNLGGLQLADPPQDLLSNAKSLVRYMGARLRDAKRCYTMKLMLIGKAGIGKTTLMHRLKGEDSFNKNQSTTGIDIQEVLINNGSLLNQSFTFRVWDFAGQIDYYSTHQCFLSECSLYLLIWDMSLKEEGLLQLEPWLDTLSARVANCSVILVGTKIDLAETNDLKAFEISMIACAKRLVSKKSIYSKLKIESLLHVTSNVSYKDFYSMMETTKNTIYNAAESMTHNGKDDGIRIMGEKIPLSYLMLETKLNELQKEKQRNNELPMLSRDEFLIIIENLNCKDTLEVDELDEVTSFLNKSGTILHYDDPHDNLKDIYFISPSWLCRLMAKVITVKQANNFYDDKGILKIDKIRLIIGERNEEFPVNFYPKYLRLLYRFQIACRIDERRLLVPSKLPDKKPKGYKPDIDKKNLLTRYHLFSCIPYGFWTRFISRLLLLLHEMLSPNSKQRNFSIMEDAFMSTCSSPVPKIIEEDAASIDSEDEDDESPYMPNVNGSTSPTVVYVNETENEKDGDKNYTRPNVNGEVFNYIAYVDESHSPMTYPKHSSHNSADRSFSTESYGDKYPVPEYSSSLSNEFNELPFDSINETESCGSDCEKIVNRQLSDTSKDGNQNNTQIQHQINTSNNHFEHDNINNDAITSITGTHVTGDYQGANNNTEVNDEKLTKPINDVPSNSQKTISTENNFKDKKDEDAFLLIDNETNHLTNNITSDINEAHNNNNEVFEETYKRKYSQQTASCCGECNESNISEGIDLFTTPVDIACLLDTEIMTCWKDGIIFNHPNLFFSIQLSDLKIENREAIETKISKTPLGYRVLGFVVDHIKTLVKEWFNNLSGTDGKSPFVMQTMPCPVCIRMGINPPHLFDLQDVFERIYCREKTSSHIQCPRRHMPQVVKVNELCPELLFEDISPRYRLNQSKLVLDEANSIKLGSGGYGTVYKCEYDSRPVATKLYKYSDDICQAFEQFVDTRQEITMLTKLQGHPFVVEFLGFLIQPKLCVVLELANEGTLKDVLYPTMIESTGECYTTPLDRIVLYRIVMQVASALDFMDSKNIIHRDIKSENILMFSTSFNSDINVKVTDFGTTNFTCPTGMKVFIGTQGFIAPEIYDAHRKDEYTSKIDVYSLAMVVYEIVTRRRPFNDCEFEYMISRAVTKGERPKYKDVRKSLHGLYSLTDAMLEMWQQESFRRPTAKDVYKLFKEPSFQLLYGKRALEVPQNPRFMCYVPLVNELWVVCDDRRGAYVLIYNVISASMEILTIDGARYGLDPFNLVHICLIEKTQVAIVLRGSHDVMLTFSTDKKRDIKSFHSFIDEHISSIACSKEFIFTGFQHGKCLRTPIKYLFDKKKAKNEESINMPNEYKSISAIVVNERYLVLANDRCLYLYEIDNLSSHCNMIRLKAPDQPVREIVLSYDRTKVFVSFQSSPIVLLIHIESLDILYQFDCGDTIRSLCENANNSDIRITCMCSFADVLWVGNGSGHILIIEHNNCTNQLSLLTSLQPYTLEMRTLCLAVINETDDGVEYLVLCSGKTLNDSIYGKDSFCKIEPSFPIDNAFSDGGRSSPFQPISTVTNETKTILIWQGLSASRMKNILEYKY